MWNDYGWHGYGIGMGLMMILFWTVLIAVIVWLVIALTGRGAQAGASREPSALDILNQRYARGEIDRQDYEQKKKDLTE